MYLKSAGLDSADLKSAGLRSADLKSVDLSSVDLSSVTLGSIILSSVTLGSIILSSVILLQIILRLIVLRRWEVVRQDFDLACLTQRQLVRESLVDEATKVSTVSLVRRRNMANKLSQSAAELGRDHEGLLFAKVAATDIHVSYI